MRFGEESPLTIMSEAYRELTRDGKETAKDITVDALLAATRGKVEHWQVEEFLASQRKGEEQPRKYFDG